MPVIGVVGLPGSGKGEVASVAENLDISVTSTGETVYEECRKRGLDPDVHHGEVAKELIEEEGSLSIIKRTIPRVKEEMDTHGTVLIEGIRSDTVVQFLNQKFGEEFKLLSIEAPYELRAERTKGREKESEEGETLKERDEREKSFGIHEAMGIADACIENTESKQEFHERIERTLLRLIDEDS